MTRRPRGLFAWYRVLPLLAVVAMGLVCAAYAYAPAALFSPFYPLEHEEEILSSSTAHGVDPFLVAAIIRTESSWDESAQSSQGAQGLMQLLPSTAQDMIDKGLVDGERFSADNLDDPATNIEFGCAYLSYLIGYFNGATDRAIAAYNAGMANVNDWVKEDTVLHNAITFPETQAYLIRVTNAYDRYRQIYASAFA